MFHSHLRRAWVLPFASLGLLTAGAGAASAHVTISPSEGTAGSYTVLTASVPHGCDGSPTTKVAIKLPEQLLSVTPTRNPLWTVKKVMRTLDEPVTDAHGNEVTERVAQVVYTARTPLPDGYRDAFELSLQVPDVAGETLVFPVIQTCAEGRTAWVETADAGSAEELEAPAPTLSVLAATEGGDAHGDHASTSADSTAVLEPVSASTAGDSISGTSGLAVAGLVAGLLGLAAGSVALVQVRRRS